MEKQAKTILIIDDDPDFILVCSSMIKDIDSSFRCVSAKSTVEAFLKCQKQQFSILFTDFNLPNFNGVDFINTLRKIDGYSQTPVILISADIDSVQIPKYLHENTYKMKKPISANGLKNAFSQIITTPSPQEKTSQKRKPKVDVGFVNVVLSSFTDVLSKMSYFKDIKKMETQKVDPETYRSFEFFTSFVLHSKQFSGVLTLGFPRKTLEPYFSKMRQEQGPVTDIEIFNALSKLLLSKVISNFKDEGQRLEAKVIVGIGEIIFLSMDSSFLEFENIFKSSVGDFFIQVSVSR